MIKHMVTSAVFAGFAAGLLAALLHLAFVQKLILLAEDYETGALVHFNGLAKAPDPAVNPSAAPATVAASDPSSTAAPQADAASGQGMAATGAAMLPPGEMARDLWTSLFYGLTYVGYALVLVAGYGLAETFGKTISAREGLIWGFAGFAAFQVLPAMGLPPELPGIVAADLVSRQQWWIGAVLSSAAGLVLLGYGKGVAAWIGGIFLLAIPHVIGAPELESYSGIVPPELAATFASRVFGVGLIVWSTMGAVSGWLWSRPQ